MTFEDLIKTIQEQPLDEGRKIPKGIDVPRGTLRIGPAEEGDEEPILPKAVEAEELDDEEIEALQQELAQPG